MQNKDEMSETLSQLESEAIILNKLLTRNNNQHRKSKPHIFLKTVSRFVMIINKQADDVHDINRDVERLLRTHHKITGPSVSESVQCMLGLHKIVTVSCETIYWIERAAKEAGGYIAQMVFLPLFTTYLALSARLHALVSALLLHHARRMEVFRCSLQTASVTAPQHSKTLCAALAAYALPPSSLDVVHSLSHPPSTSEGTPSLATVDSVIASPLIAASVKAIHTLAHRSSPGSGDDDIGEDIGCEREARVPTVSSQRTLQKEFPPPYPERKTEKEMRTEIALPPQLRRQDTDTQSPPSPFSTVKKRPLEDYSVRNKNAVEPSSSVTNAGKQASMKKQKIPPAAADRVDSAKKAINVGQRVPEGGRSAKKKRKSKKGDDIDDIFGSLPF